MSDEREPIGFGVEVAAPIDEAIERTKAALQAEGFGVLTSIDVRQTMKDKLGETFEPYVILGACNPRLAWRALQAEHQIGLLLPCNLIVHQHGDRSLVSVADPVAMMSLLPSDPDVAAVAAEARERLQRVVAALGAES